MAHPARPKDSLDMVHLFIFIYAFTSHACNEVDPIGSFHVDEMLFVFRTSSFRCYRRGLGLGLTLD